jgi:anti-anti-sigma factor
VHDARFDVVVVGNDALVSAHGELDLFCVDRLRVALAEVDHVQRVTVDLKGVTFIDSAALGCLAAVADARAGAGRTLRVEHAHGLVRRLMDLLQLDALRRP